MRRRPADCARVAAAGPRKTHCFRSQFDLTKADARQQ
jgi:hypothetical protein